MTATTDQRRGVGAVLTGPWRSAAGLVALVLIAAQTAWRGVLLAHGYLTQDDYLMIRLGSEPLGPGMLFQEYSGHVWPGNFLLAWANARLGPLEWPLYVGEILALQLAVALGSWLVLCRLLPGSWARVPVLAVGLFCPLALWPTTWWAAAIGYLPISALLMLATWALLVHLQEGRRWAPVVVVLSTLVALAFQERTVLFPVVLGIVAVALAPVRGWRAVPVALRNSWRLWTALVVLLVAYLVLHRVLAPLDAGTVGSASGAARLVGDLVARSAVPGLVGGPWQMDVLGDSLVVPAAWSVVVAWVLLSAVVVWSLWRSRAAGWGWLLLLAYALLNGVLLLAGRAELGAAIGLVPRYAADLVPVLVVSLGLVARAVLAARAGASGASGSSGSSGPPPAGPRRLPALVALGFVAVYLASAAVTTVRITPHLLNSADRDFVEGLRASLREQPEAVLVDSTPPEDVMTFWFGSDASVSTLVGLAPERPIFGEPTHDLRIADAEGALRPVELVGVETPARDVDGSCGIAVRDQQVSVPLRDGVAGELVVVRLDYYTASPGTLRVRVGGGPGQVATLREAGTLYLTASGEVEQVGLAYSALPDRDVADAPGADPGTVCVTGVAVGFPVAGQ